MPFDDLIRSSAIAFLDEASQDLDQHPEPEELALYHSGNLPPQRFQDVQNHLMACDECISWIIGLEELSEEEVDLDKGSDDFDLATSWRSLMAHLEAQPTSQSAASEAREPMPTSYAEIRRTRTGDERRDGGEPSISASLWASRVAAVLALAAVGLLAWTLSVQRSVDRLSQPQLDVPVLDLRSAVRRGESIEGRVDVPATALSFALVMNPDEEIRSDTHQIRYQVRLYDSQDREIWRKEGLQPNEFGSFSLLLHRRFLPDAGAYEIHLLRLENNREARPLGEYEFTVLAR